MTLPLVLRIALYLLVADGLFALYLAEFLGARGVLLVSALLVAAWLLQPAVGRGRASAGRAGPRAPRGAGLGGGRRLSHRQRPRRPREAPPLPGPLQARDAPDRAGFPHGRVPRVLHARRGIGVGVRRGIPVRVRRLRRPAELDRAPPAPGEREPRPAPVGGGRDGADPLRDRAGGRRGRGGVRGGGGTLLPAAAGGAGDPAAARAPRPDDHRLLRAGGARLVRKHPHRLERRHAGPPARRGPARPVPEPPVAGRRAGHLRRAGLEHPVPAPHPAGPAELGRLRRGAPAGERPVPAPGDLPRADRLRGDIHGAAGPPRVDAHLGAGDGRHGRGVRRRPPAPGSGTRSSPSWRAHRYGARRSRARRLRSTRSSSSATCSCPSWRRRFRRSRGRSRARARRRRRSPAAWRRSCGPSSATRSTSSG